MYEDINITGCVDWSWQRMNNWRLQGGGADYEILRAETHQLLVYADDNLFDVTINGHYGEKETFFFLWRCGPTRATDSAFLRFLDHTQRWTTDDRTPLDEWSARRRDLYLTTHNTHNRQTSMPPVGFEPTISAGERPQTHALDRAATGTGNKDTLFVVKREMGLQMDLEKATYSRYLNYVRFAFRETSRKQNFALAEISLNSIQFNFFISRAEKITKLCFEMCNKRIKTSAGTKENITWYNVI